MYRIGYMDWKNHPPGSVLAQAPHQGNQHIYGLHLNGMVASHNLVQNQNHQVHWRNHPDIGRAQDSMILRIYQLLLKHAKASIWGQQKIEKMVISCEKVLVGMATSMEEYLNDDTLEERVNELITLMENGHTSDRAVQKVQQISTAGSASEGFQNVSVAFWDNPTFTPAYSRTCGNSLGDAVKQFYNAHIVPEAWSTNFQGHPSSNGFSNGLSSLLTNIGSNVGCYDMSLTSGFTNTQPVDFYLQPQQQTLLPTNTQPMNYCWQSQQLPFQPYLNSQFVFPILHEFNESQNVSASSGYNKASESESSFERAKQSSGMRRPDIVAGSLMGMSVNMHNFGEDSVLANQNIGTRRSHNDALAIPSNNSVDIQNPRKYLKVEGAGKTLQLKAIPPEQPCLPQRVGILKEEFDENKPITPKIVDMKKELSRSFSECHTSVNETEKSCLSCSEDSSEELLSGSNQEDVYVETKLDFSKTEIESDVIAVGAGHVPCENSGKKRMSVSLTETFTPEQIFQHIASLKSSACQQSKRKEDISQATTHCYNENVCKLCSTEKLYFEPHPIYCGKCLTCIKYNLKYYTTAYGVAKYSICTLCFSRSHGEHVKFGGVSLLKSMMEKKINNEGIEEPWVQCDKCEGWQHQVCALFNDKRNCGENTEYICPKCFVQEIRNGKRTPILQSDMLGAKDLPRTMLSDHIEKRLFVRLKQEREERAKTAGKNFNEVLGAEDLVVRVVLSVDKFLQVKPQFLDLFKKDKYLKDIPYKLKFILLFQKIEGVEVCLFGMYVQEFGSRCGHPNKRCVYLSYLDSVKYFRPEIKTVRGEALRTFVYHEILIGYLDYCKKRGFTSCFIWTCPPSKGDDFILYRHPEIQKTPKQEKLREWYLAMQKKATYENIVVAVSNLYEEYFLAHGELKVTATRLPYFDGDYWPGAAETIISELKKEEAGGELKTKVNSRTLKAMGYTEPSAHLSKDVQLMSELGKTIFPLKESFILMQLQHSCTECRQMILNGKRWFCRQCKEFQLCNKCYEEEQNREECQKHPIKSKKKHVLSAVDVNGVPLDTEDSDGICENKLFESREAFLNICQENNYQYDSLRRAKQSSMMILYHLHTLIASTSSVLCNPDIQRREGREVNSLVKFNEWVLHASQCHISRCPFKGCYQIKSGFKHFKDCKIRFSGGCIICKKLWSILQYHSRICKSLECAVPRCKDLKKENEKRRQLKSESIGGSVVD